MRLVDNMDRHKISNEFEFRSDRTTDFGVTCPLVLKKTHMPPCPEHSLLSFIRNFMKLADNLDKHKISDEFEFWLDRTIHFGVTGP